MNQTHLDACTLDLIKEHVRRLIVIMSFDDAKVECSTIEGDILKISIEVGDSGNLLIGAQGVHLAALQHVVRCVLHKQLEKPAHIIVDVNGYRARREKTRST